MISYTDFMEISGQVSDKCRYSMCMYIVCVCMYTSDTECFIAEYYNKICEYCHNGRWLHDEVFNMTKCQPFIIT